MAVARILNNILDEKVDEVSIEKGSTIESVIRDFTEGDLYTGTLVECYDSETGKTFFAPIEDDVTTSHIIATVNGKDAQLDYQIKEDDIVGIIILPAGGKNAWELIGAAIGAVAGAIAGAVIGFAIGGIPGAVMGGIFGGGLGMAFGAMLGGALYDMTHPPETTSDNGIQSEKLPDVRGAQNQPLTDNAYPMVIGKHLVTPFILGTPWNEISGRHGENNVIHALYVVGYAPLRVSDFKLGEMFLAHNQKWAGNENMKNIYHGALTGTDDVESGRTGDIVNTWHSNDITLEILQQGQNGEAIDYGNVYPYAKIQNEIKANCLYIVDTSLQENDIVSYKGIGLKNGLRNNVVRFSEQCPGSLKVELDFASGLYRTRSEGKEHSTTKYYTMPLWVAIQWRVYSEENDVSDGIRPDEETVIPTYDYENKKYSLVDGKVKRNWHSFATINNTVNSTVFTAGNRNDDISYHTGNTIRAADVNNEWIGAHIFNLQPLGGTNEDHDGINEFRCVTEVDLVQWAEENLRADGDSDEVFAEKYKAYFLDGTNTTKSIEVRVVRISPCYIDETVNSDDHSAFRFNDNFTWATLTSTKIDADKLINDNIIEFKRPITEERMRKLCVVALKASTDNTDQLSNTIKKFTCVAQSFAPYFNNETKKWVPENVIKTSKYYKPSYTDEFGGVHKGEEITKEQYEQDRQNGIKSVEYPDGNDYIKNLVTNEIRIEENLDEKGRYYLPDDGDAIKHCQNNVASIFLQTLIGAHLGCDALSYIQSNFEENGIGDINLNAFKNWYNWAEDVTDGSTFPTDSYHYNANGERVSHKKGDTVHIKFAANAYIYQQEKLDSVLAKIAVAGRGVWFRDSKSRITVAVDKPEKYPVGLINQQTVLQSSYSIVFDNPTSGIQLTYPDENDGYEKNTLYCLADGETAENPSNAIEPVNFDYVTNNYQMWSLGRYYLANRIMNREIVQKKIGGEGANYPVGSVVLLSDSTMLIGTDSGGRITKLLEDDTHIYGFLINNTYHYTGEEEPVLDSAGNEIIDTDTGNVRTQCKQGVTILQPSQYGASRVIDVRLAKVGSSYTTDTEAYTLVKGDTNIVLFSVPMAKDTGDDSGSDYFVFKPKLDNIVAFGIIGKITAKYRVIKVEPDNKHNFRLTLIQYQDEVYNYGRTLPSFQNNMTLPDRSDEDAFALSENVKYKDLIDTLTQASNMNQNKVDSSFNKVPPVPLNVVGVSGKESIKFNSNVPSVGISNLDYVEYKIVRRNGTEVIVNGKTAAEYAFDRNTDLYPEFSDLQTWRIYARSVAMFTDSNGNRIASEWVEGTLDNDSYGTWIIPPLFAGTHISTEVNGRAIALRMITPSGSRPQYGSTIFRVSIKRTGLAQSGEGYPEVVPDEHWFKPDLYSSPFSSDEAYKVAGSVDGYEESSNRFTQTLPLAGQNSDNIVNTVYEYQIVATNESGYTTEPVSVSVTAECTSIRDIVKANEDFKKLYVEELSAISANLGVISEGGFGSFNERKNYWALSDLTEEECGVPDGVKKGTFRVGGDNQYLSVTPDPDHDGEYIIELQAGSITLKSGGETEFGQGTYIYDKFDKNIRLALTASGMIAQKKEGDVWTNVSKFLIDSKGNLIISNSNETPPFGFKVSGTIYHFDNDPEKDENDTNGQNISCEGELVSNEDLSPILSLDSSLTSFSGTVEKDISEFTGRLVYLSKSNGFEAGYHFGFDGSKKATAEAYNNLMRKVKGEGTVGSYLGLTQNQIEQGIFEEASESNI